MIKVIVLTIRITASERVRTVEWASPLDLARRSLCAPSSTEARERPGLHARLPASFLQTAFSLGLMNVHMWNRLSNQN